MQWWAKLVTRSAWLWIIGWSVAAVAIGLAAPRIPTLLEDSRRGFLPADMPSQRAFSRLRAEFPNEAFESRAVAVFDRVAGLTAEDREFIARIADALRGQSEAREWRVRAVEGSPFLRPILESPDGKAAIIVVDLPSGALTHHTVKRVREIERILRGADPPDGLVFALTGNAAMGALLDSSAKRDVDLTTLWAIVAVAVILLVVYRSPIAMLLPLVSIALALVVSLGLIGWAASAGWPLNGLVQMFVVVIVVGAGTDYCLFLFARFREDFRAGTTTVGGAALSALVHSGPAIVAAAGTNAVGLATLALARNRDLHTSGPTIAAAIVVAALAVLSFAAALIFVFGHRLLDRHTTIDGADSDGRLWRLAADLVTNRPWGVTIVVATVLGGAATVGAVKRIQPVYDSLDQFPADSSFVRGAKLYSEHFHGGRPVADATLVISVEHRIDAPELREGLNEALDALAVAIRGRLPVVFYRDFRFPLGRPSDGEGVGELALLNGVPAALIEQFARPAYVGVSGKSVRVDLGLAVEPRSISAMRMLDELRDAAGIAREISTFNPGGSSEGAAGVKIEIAGETAAYADMRDLRRRDFAVIAAAAITSIGLILVWLIRSVAQALILIAATLLTYLATYGASWFIVREVFGQPALGWQIDFLLFIVVLSLGQDYNIFVVARIREELAIHPPREAISLAIRRTGRVVSSCGVIMAATFASMFAGSLLIMKEFAVALSLAMLIDTFVVRPLLVPAAILLLYRMRRTPRLESWRRIESTEG